MELAGGLGLVVALVMGGRAAVARATQYLDVADPPTVAAAIPPTVAAAIEPTPTVPAQPPLGLRAHTELPEPSREVPVEPPLIELHSTTVFPAPDADLLGPLAAPLAKVKFNRGGTSLSLRLDFEGGGRAAFKPQQTHWQSDPRKELAAYRLDRLLGIGRVPPAMARTFAVADLLGGLDPRVAILGKERLATEAISRDGRLVGVLSWWIPELRDAMIRGFAIDSTDGVVTWRRLLKVGARYAPAEATLLAGISTMTAFDFLIDNLDRWSGGNAKVAARTDELYFMDNTMSFTSDERGHRKSRIYLERVQLFSRAFVDSVRGLDAEAIAAAMAEDHGDLKHVLTAAETRALVGRRDALLAYVDELVTRHGEAAILVFP